jgi:hypothetical protein
MRRDATALANTRSPVSTPLALMTCRGELAGIHGTGGESGLAERHGLSAGEQPMHVHIGRQDLALA